MSEKSFLIRKFEEKKSIIFLNQKNSKKIPKNIFEQEKSWKKYEFILHQKNRFKIFKKCFLNQKNLRKTIRIPNFINFDYFQIRDQIINQSTGSKWVFVKYHHDFMVRKNDFFNKLVPKLTEFLLSKNREEYPGQNDTTSGPGQKILLTLWQLPIPGTNHTVFKQEVKRRYTEIFIQKSTF